MVLDVYKANFCRLAVSGPPDFDHAESARTVEVAGVDVVHPARDRLAQHDQCRVMVLGRHAGACELHGTVTKERAPTEADAPS